MANYGLDGFLTTSKANAENSQDHLKSEEASKRNEVESEDEIDKEMKEELMDDYDMASNKVTNNVKAKPKKSKAKKKQSKAKD